MNLRVLLEEKDPWLLRQEGVTHLATGEHVGELHEELQIWEVGRCRKGPQGLPAGSKSMPHLHMV